MTKRFKQSFLLVVLVVSTLVSSLSLFLPNRAQTANADSNFATWILCGTDDGKMLYNIATTELLPYTIRSKSNIVRTERTDGFLNGVLGMAGFNFDEVNESILGRPIEPTTIDKGEDEKEEPKEDDKEKEAANPNSSAPRVNPFDRFGVAGLRWSSYAGEWKYYQVDGCSVQSEANQTTYGAFYPDRKEPKDTYRDIHESTDPRVQQYDKGLIFSWANSFNDILTNGLFNIAKGIVAFTIALIGFAFSDITTIMGMSGGDSPMIQLFRNLYTGIFQPFQYLMFFLTACYMIYWGLFKRQYRQALNSLLQAVVCLLLAAIIGSNPEFWVPLPNRVATYGEAIVIAALGQSTDDHVGLCGTNVGKMESGSSSITLGGNEAQRKSEMDKIGDNMKSTIGCRMWEEFLLKPWTRGQFGNEYENLVAGGKKGGKIKNINHEWTKNADVPLGANVVENNWALFQISAQTNAHAQYDDEKGVVTDPSSNMVRQVDGVSSDWWRVVDAFSNYDEHEVVKNFGKLNGDSDTTAKVVEQKPSEPLEEWQSWVGNRQADRYGTAFLAIIFGALGSLGPLIFALLTTIYSAGVTMLMAMAPIFLMFGCWAGKGDGILKGWAAALLSTMIKKVVAAGLLLISFAFTINAMDMIDEVGWIKSFMLLFLMTMLLIKSRHQIMETFANVNFGSTFRPDQMFAGYRDKKAEQAKDAGLIATGAAVGAVEAKKVGLKASDGALMGAGTQLNNTLRKSAFGRQANISYRKFAGVNPSACFVCGGKVDGQAYYDEDGNVMCHHCAIDSGMETELMRVELLDQNVPLMSEITEDELKDNPKCSRCKGEMDEEGYMEDGSPVCKKCGKDEFDNFKTIGKHQKGNQNKVSLQASYKSQMKRISKQRLINRDITKHEMPKLNEDARNLIHGTKNTSWLSYSKASEIMNLHYNDEGKIDWDSQEVENMILTNLIRLEGNIEEYEQNWMKYGDAVSSPSLPEPIESYISQSAIDEAWHSGRYELVRDTYKNAWGKWYEEGAMSIETVDEETRQAVKKAINAYDSEAIYNEVKDTTEYEENGMNFNDDRFQKLKGSTSVNQETDQIELELDDSTLEQTEKEKFLSEFKKSQENKTPSNNKLKKPKKK